MAVISLDFSSVATWPRAIPSSLAQALTMCSGAEAVAPRRATADRSCRRWRRAGPGRRRRSGSRRRSSPGSTLEGLGLEGHEQAADAIARGDAVGQGEELVQPDPPVLGPAMDGRRAIAAADHAADGDDDDIDQQMFAIARVPGVGERLEVGADGADIDELGHGRHPGIGRCRPPLARTGGVRPTER